MKTTEITPEKIFAKYITDKLDMLENDFRIRLGCTEYDHIWSLKTELEVDQYVHDLIMNKL